MKKKAIIIILISDEDATIEEKSKSRRLAKVALPCSPATKIHPAQR